ncbi:MAG: cation:proton antiporter [Candidatus Cyclonatronum sp.]|uniref:cation:proton antiporter n=1 Tax=Cyclonatronum sp. TaxID=3024185 RepID=UPI0025B7CC9E|nr:cation:proton antiporter [Cyclonatronum sp.]MCH8487559.1 cation:proton antiporter [Cyclonatronum sp.]
MDSFVISISTEPVLTFGLLLLIILVVPILFQKIRLPGIVGLLLAGTFVGPKGLGFIEAAGVIDVLGKVGLLYLMFLAGLEINLSQFKKDRNNTLVFGALTFLIPQISGTLIFIWIGYSVPASILIASMFASHTLVAYPIISRLGLNKEKSVTTAVGGTIITDTVALLVLAVVARSVDGDLDTLFWVTLIGLFALYLVFMFVIFPKMSFSFFQYMGEKGRFTYVYVIGMMLMCSWLAEVIGIEAIVGAFLAGLALNPLLSNKGPLKNRVEFFGDAFFIPLFLIFVGMQVDVQVLTSGYEVWFIMGVMTAIVVVSKWVAAFTSSKLLGFSNDQAWVIFGLTNSQAAATLAATFIGMEVGLIGEEILNGAIMMILVTCIIGPMVVEKFGLKLTDDDTLELETDTKIRQRLLVPLANPVTSARLIEFASNLKTDDKSPIFPLAVINTFKDEDKQRERAHKTLEVAKGHIHAVNSQANPVVETNLNIAEGIRNAAANNAITDIVIGWNGVISTPMRIFGSILDQVLLTTKQQTYICKITKPVSTFNKIVVVMNPQSYSGRNSLALLESLFKLAENLKTGLEILYFEQDESKLNRDLYLIQSEQEMSLRSVRSIEDIINIVLNDLSESDLLVMVNSRSGKSDWFRTSNVIPSIISTQKPDLSFVTAFPASLDKEDYLTDILYSN